MAVQPGLCCTWSEIPDDRFCCYTVHILTRKLLIFSFQMVVTDVYNHRFHKVFSPSEALSHIMDRDDIFVYQVPISSVDDQNFIVIPIYLREERY